MISPEAVGVAPSNAIGPPCLFVAAVGHPKIADHAAFKA